MSCISFLIQLHAAILAAIGVYGWSYVTYYDDGKFRKGFYGGNLLYAARGMC